MIGSNIITVRHLNNKKECRTYGYLDVESHRLRAIESDTGNPVRLSLDSVEVSINGEYTPLSVCLDTHVLLFDLLRTRIGYPNSDVELEQGYNWV